MPKNIIIPTYSEIRNIIKIKSEISPKSYNNTENSYFIYPEKCKLCLSCLIGGCDGCNKLSNNNLKIFHLPYQVKIPPISWFEKLLPNPHKRKAESDIPAPPLKRIRVQENKLTDANYVDFMQKLSFADPLLIRLIIDELNQKDKFYHEFVTSLSENLLSDFSRLKYIINLRKKSRDF